MSCFFHPFRGYDAQIFPFRVRALASLETYIIYVCIRKSYEVEIDGTEPHSFQIDFEARNLFSFDPFRNLGRCRIRVYLKSQIKTYSLLLQSDLGENKSCSCKKCLHSKVLYLRSSLIILRICFDNPRKFNQFE